LTAIDVMADQGTASRRLKDDSSHMSRLMGLLGACICAVLVNGTFGSRNHGSWVRRSTSFCADSTASTTVSMTYFRSLATSVDPEDTLIRNRVSLPALSTDDVTFVSDTMLCRRAAEGIRRSIYSADTGALASVELYRYGATRYLGDWPRRVGEFGATAVLDTTFHVVGLIAQ
jgi:hypothetical protein